MSELITKLQPYMEKISPGIFEQTYQQPRENVSWAGEQDTVWRSNGLSKAIQTLQMVEMFIDDSSFRPEATHFLPGEGSLAERFKIGRRTLISETQRHHGSPPLTLWRHVARTWLLVNSLDLSQTTTQFELSNIRVPLEKDPYASIYGADLPAVLKDELASRTQAEEFVELAETIYGVRTGEIQSYPNGHPNADEVIANLWKTDPFQKWFLSAYTNNPLYPARDTHVLTTGNIQTISELVKKIA